VLDCILKAPRVKIVSQCSSCVYYGKCIAPFDEIYHENVMFQGMSCVILYIILTNHHSIERPCADLFSSCIRHSHTNF